MNRRQIKKFYCKKSKCKKYSTISKKREKCLNEWLKNMRDPLKLCDPPSFIGPSTWSKMEYRMKTSSKKQNDCTNFCCDNIVEGKCKFDNKEITECKQCKAYNKCNMCKLKDTCDDSLVDLLY